MPTGDRLVALSASGTLPTPVETRINTLAAQVAQTIVNALPAGLTTQQVQTIANQAAASATTALVAAAPGALDTLDELAAALGDDANFAATIMAAVGAKYTMPSTGIPKTDLDSAVQTSLNKADAAVVGDSQGRVSVGRRATVFGGDAIPVIGWGGASNYGGFSNSQVGTGYTSRILYKAVIDATNIRLVFPGWYSNTGAETVVNNDLYLKVAIEFGGTFHPVTFNGQRSVTLNPWGTLVSDPVSIDLKKGESFAVRTFYDTPASGAYLAGTPTAGPPVYGAPVGGGLTGYGYGSGNTVDAVTAVSNTGGGPWPGPMTVIGTPLGATPKVLIGIGDSITHGQGESAPFQTGAGGYLTRAVNDTIPHFKTAIVGSRAGSWQGRLLGVRMASYWSMGTHASVMLCTNDIHLDSRSLAYCQSALLDIYARLVARGLKVNACTLVPQTTSTDGWVTTANQTPKSQNSVRVALNDWIRAGAPIDPATKAAVAVGTAGALVAGQTGHPLWGYFETADPVESARNSGLWAPSMTGDGTHPTTAGHTAMAAAVDLTRLP